MRRRRSRFPGTTFKAPGNHRRADGPHAPSRPPQVLCSLASVEEDKPEEGDDGSSPDTLFTEHWLFLLFLFGTSGHLGGGGRGGGAKLQHNHPLTSRYYYNNNWSAVLLRFLRSIPETSKVSLWAELKMLFIMILVVFWQNYVVDIQTTKNHVNLQKDVKPHHRLIKTKSNITTINAVKMLMNQNSTQSNSSNSIFSLFFSLLYSFSFSFVQANRRLNLISNI